MNCKTAYNILTQLLADMNEWGLAKEECGECQEAVSWLYDEAVKRR